MADTMTPRSEPILDTGPLPMTGPLSERRPAVPVSALLGPEPARPESAKPEPARPESTRPVTEPVVAASSAMSGGSDQLGRIEEKTARIEEKFARQESASQRVMDRFDAAAHRMGEVALQSDLAAVRGEVALIARKVRGLPGFGALMVTAIVAALLSAGGTVAIIKYLPALLAR